MTTAADDAAVEQAFEAFLAGRSVPAEGADLAAFAGAVRRSATEPGRPNAALAELLTTGLLVAQPPLSARTAKRRRRPMWFFTAIIAKIASAGAVAQAATGAGLVLVGFTGMGAAGALPAPAQHTFATVVAAITPLSPQDGSSTSSGATSSTSSSAPVSTSDAPTTDPASTSSAAPTDTVTVTTAPGSSAAATTSAPKNFGQLVSSWAHERNAERKAEHDAEHKAQETDAPETQAPETESPETDGGSAHGDHGGQGDSGHGDN